MGIKRGVHSTPPRDDRAKGKDFTAFYWLRLRLFYLKKKGVKKQNSAVKMAVLGGLLEFLNLCHTLLWGDFRAHFSQSTPL